MSGESTVTIIRTGVANTASLIASFSRLGLRSVLSEDRDEIERAERLVLPGVGAFGSGVATLDRLGLREVLGERAGSERPLLAVCLGMQLLAEASEETPGSVGLGVVSGTVKRFGKALRVPQMGWNEVEPDSRTRLLTSGCAYFANSYRLTEAPEGWAVARTDYGGPFVGAMERGRTLACQFHPELSGRWGLDLLARWAGVERSLSAQSVGEVAKSC